VNFQTKELINKLGITLYLGFDEVFESGITKEEIYNRIREEYEKSKEILEKRLFGEEVKWENKNYEKMVKPKVKILVRKDKELKEAEIFYKLVYGNEIAILEEGKTKPIEYWKGYLLSVLYKKLHKDTVIFLTKAPIKDIKELIYRDIGVIEGKTYKEVELTLIEKLSRLPKKEKEYKEFIKNWEEEIWRLLYFRPNWIKQVQEGLLFFLISEELSGREKIMIEEYYKQMDEEVLTPYERKYKKYLENITRIDNQMDYFLEDLEEYDCEIRIEEDKALIEINEENWIERLGTNRIEVPKWVFDFVLNKEAYECPLRLLSKLKKAEIIYEFSQFTEKRLKEVYTKYKLLIED
jgi:hypothetical protein